MDSEDVKRTTAKLHLTFLSIPFMNINQLLKIVVTNVDMAEVYASNGNVYYYEKDLKHKDRLEQVRYKQM